MEIKFDKAHDPDGMKLCKLLTAHETYERLGAARSLVVHLLALVGILVWLDAGWPDLLPRLIQTAAFTLWEVFFCLTLSTSIGEWIWYRRQMYYWAKYHEKQKEPWDGPRASAS